MKGIYIKYKSDLLCTFGFTYSSTKRKFKKNAVQLK